MLTAHTTYLIAGFGSVNQDFQGKPFLCRLLHTYPEEEKKNMNALHQLAFSK